MSDQPPSEGEGSTWGWAPPPVPGPPADPTQPIGPPAGPPFGGPEAPPPVGPPAGPPPGGIPAVPPPAGPPPGYPPQTPGYPPAGYPQPGYGPPGYPQPGYGYGYPAQAEHPQGTIVLVLGILSLVLLCACGVGAVIGLVAWIMGQRALKEIDAQPGRYSNRGSVQAGRIMGIVATAMGALWIVWMIISSILSTSSGY